MTQPHSHLCDLLVIGTGASGLTAAVTARKAGLEVLMVEKDGEFGGTSAASGGMLWIPGNRHSAPLAARLGVTDSAERARAYICEEAGDYGDPRRVDAFLRYGPQMVDFLENETDVKFYAVDFPDYHSQSHYGSVVRTIATVDYHASALGDRVRTMCNVLPQTLFMGFAIGSSVEMKQFMRAGRSVKALLYVMRRLAIHFGDILRYGRSQQMVRGRALVGRLARTAFDLGIPIWLASPAKQLIVRDGAVAGAVVHTPYGPVDVRARKAVVLASGGFPGDIERRKQSYPPVVVRTNDRGIWATGNTGDGARMAEAAGGQFAGTVSNPAAWIPVSIMPGRPGLPGVWPHFVDRNKPGFIAVLKSGRRFVSEAASYQDFVPALIRACENDDHAYCWLIADRRAVDRYGIGFVRPAPIPRGRHLRSGYLLCARTLAELAVRAGIDGPALEETVRQFNMSAAEGRDPAFNRGGRAYDRYQGDDEHLPNPCIGPLGTGPYYAVKIVPGDMGTFAGIAVDEYSRVLTAQGQPISGLYAVGNDQASVWGGAYPGAGSTLGPGMTFAWIAANHAAGLIPETSGHNESDSR